MDIVFCINNNWSMQCGVTIKSILEFNKSPITFHIFSKNPLIIYFNYNTIYIRMQVFRVFFRKNCTFLSL